MKNLKSKKIWSEFILDIVLIIYSAFFLQSIISADQWIFNSINIGYILIAAGISTFFIIWYFGILFNVLEKSTHNFNLLIVLGLMCLWIAVSQGFTLVENIGWIYDAEEDSAAIVIGYYFVIIYGVILGILFAATEVTDDIRESRLQKRILFLRIFSGNFIFYLAIYLQVSVSMDKTSDIIFSISLWAFLFLLGFFIYTFPLEKKLEKRAKTEMILEGKTMISLKHYILPFILITSLCLLGEIYVWGKLHSAAQAKEIVTNWEMIIHLTLSGIIPIRILFAIHPPLNIFGIVGGLVSISYFIYACTELLNSFFWGI